jgi:hypothetical protein
MKENQTVMEQARAERRQNIDHEIRRLDRKTWIYGGILAALVMAAFLLPARPSHGMTVSQYGAQTTAQSNMFQFFGNMMSGLHDWASSIAMRMR